MRVAYNRYHLDSWQRQEERDTEMALLSMQKKNLNQPDDVATYGLIKKEEVVLDGVTVHRVTFDKGARWSSDLQPYDVTKSALLPHVAIIKSGRLIVVLN